MTGTLWALTDVLWQIFAAVCYCSQLFSWPFPGMGHVSAALVENTNLLAFKDDKSGFELLHQTLN